MNKKNKVLLSTVGLLLLSGVAATSSTFAWFTTVRNGSIKYTDATATTKSGSLVMTYLGSQNTLTTQPAANTIGNEIVLAGANNVTDISGNGAAFYKPVWASQEANGLDGVASVINTVTEANGFYIDFSVKVARSNDATANGLKVYLGAGTKFTDKTADSVDILPALRLAVLSNSAYGDAGNVLTPVLRWAPGTESDPAYLALGAPASDGTVYGLKTHNLEDDTLLKSGSAITTATTVAAADSLNYLVANLTGSTTEVTLTFRAWIEGNDADTINDKVTQAFSLDIDLYALEVLV